MWFLLVSGAWKSNCFDVFFVVVLVSWKKQKTTALPFFCSLGKQDSLEIVSMYDSAFLLASIPDIAVTWKRLGRSLKRTRGVGKKTTFGSCVGHS